MQPPLAAGIDQAVGDQRLQHVQPPCPFPRYRQPRRPEVIQPQLIPQMARQPASAPLPRPVQPQTAQPDMHHIAVQRRCRPILGEQRDLSGLLAALVEASIVWHHAARWLSLISPRYSTCRCTVRPPDTRRFSTMLQ